MATGTEVGKALQVLAFAMRSEGLARKTYTGERFELDGKRYIVERELKREIFERALKSYVEDMVRLS